ncbi:hypothetical protein ACO2Q9_14375 [Variovorax sp. VNK109]|jgi:hypothetical protein|uniref:hypothetical protein n=1 Tax=Variovorax sp. VNK109 TaxID=3400919 RepID=UPI003BFE2644
MRRNRLAALVLSCAAMLPGSAVHALDVNNTDFYPCVQGDCRNGWGVVKMAVFNMFIEGNWRNGNTIPGDKYLVSHALARDRKYEQYYGEDGMQDRGANIRALGAPGTSFPVFTGTYSRVDHPFMRQRLAVFQEGTYALGNGIEFRGRFDYLPSRGGEAGRITTGHFIFFGDKVDTEDNTVETGLYVSTTEISSGAMIRFVKARPDYMLVLQQQYQKEQMLAADDFAQQDREKSWRMAFAILGEVAMGMANARASSGFGGGGSSSGNKFAMDMIGGMMRGAAPGAPSSANAAPADPSTRLIQMVTGAALGKMTGDKAMADKLSAAVATGIEKANAAGK